MKVVHIDDSVKKDGLLALAAVDLGGGVIIRGFRVTTGRNATIRVSVPQRVWFNGGEKYTEPLLDLPEHLRWEIFNAIRESYRNDQGPER